jgi:hypothetical protein
MWAFFVSISPTTNANSAYPKQSFHANLHVVTCHVRECHLTTGRLQHILFLSKNTYLKN